MGCAISLAIMANGAAAQTCSPQVELVAAELSERFQKQKSRLSKLNNRRDFQEILLIDLTPAQQQSVAAVPAEPPLPTDLFADDGTPDWTCDANGEAGDSPDTLSAALDAFDEELDAYDAALNARQDSIDAAAEGVAEQDAAPDNDGEAAPESDTDTAAVPEADEGGETAAAPDADDGGQAEETPQTAEEEPGADPADPGENDVADGGGAAGDDEGRETETGEAETDDAETDDAEAGDAETDNDVAADDEGGQEDAAPQDDTAVADADPADDDARKPLQDPENEFLYRRIITLPGTSLHDAAGGADTGETVPVFSVMYVFDEAETAGESWIEVGRRFREGSEGWISTEAALPWSTMLVMQFAPRGQRSRVLFFNESGTLADIVNSPFYRKDAEDYYSDIAREKNRLADEPNSAPQWNPNLVAIEPETAVTFSNQPYLLPILDFRQELYDGTIDTNLLQVAAVPADAQNVTARDEATFTEDTGEKAAADGEFRIGIAFVMDTTISMAPFIERTRETIKGFYEAFERFETTSYLSFAIIGVRDEVNPAQGADGYVTRVFQPLDPDAPPRQVLSNMDRIREATAPTYEFREDIYAGLTEAIQGQDWEPYDARLIILVTDASARGGGDEAAVQPMLTAAELREQARNRGITIVPIHLKTEPNQKNGDFQIGADQYRTLSETGDINASKYLPVDGDSDDEFRTQLDNFANGIAKAVLAANTDQVPPEKQAPRDLEITDAGDLPDTALADIVTNEIFRAKLESLATVDGGDAPTFLAGWASDRDMQDPDIETLEVSVFLTRNQLSTLDKQIDLIVGAARSGGDDTGAFFDNLQKLAAEMSTDPNAQRIDDQTAVQTILPSFLQTLPYRSQVLRLDREYWKSLGQGAQQRFIEDLEGKQRIYQDIFNRTDLWVDFGAGDPGLMATPVRLINLP